MSEPHIGYYVHHQGAGHATRALAIAQELNGPVTLIGSHLPDGPLPGHIKRLHLPADTAPGMRVEQFDSLHYAPLGVPGLRQRAALLTQWMHDHWPCLLVVDVSVEVALLARLCGVPTIYMRQHGLRDDAAHLQAYACASVLLAPYPPMMESAETCATVRGNSRYSGWISRYAGVPAVAAQPGQVLVINGHGGTAFTHPALAELADACPDQQFRVAGQVSGEPLPRPNLAYLGALAEPLAELQRAQVVIGSAGDSLVSEAASLGCRYIAVAEQRPFAEQQQQARRLDELGLAVGLQAWPEATQWPALLARAQALDGLAWQQWADAQSVRRAAAILQGTLNELFKTPGGLD